MSKEENQLQAFRNAKGINVFRPGMINAYFMDESRRVKDVVYTIEEAVSPNRDVIIPFYLPDKTVKLSRIYLNIYFPGLQNGDYPLNNPNLYIHPTSWIFMGKKNNAFFDFAAADMGYYYVSGTGADGANYYWYRGFLRYHIAPIMGFKIDKAELRWTLNSRASVGAGANTQHASVLHSIADFGTPEESTWALATAVDHGNVNIHTDAVRTAYSKDVKSRIQALLDAPENYACFRIQADTEPVDVNNANNYRINMPETLYCEMSEDTDEPISLYADNGIGFGSKLDSHKTSREDIDLGRFFSGKGKKQLKLTCNKTRRVNILLRLGYKSQ